ncbi:family 2 glycosyl transferase [Chondrocystis sp. NIES-4102]|nr:family 2 glycosyl transferase [Chondrocystis sp. NIES-4102]
MFTPTQLHNANSLLVVIVNYRTPKLTINCLHSLITEVKALPDVKVTVVDNASGDDSIEQINTAIETEGWQEWITLLPSPHNGGYAFGNNLAIQPALTSSNPPSYFYLLNPDTEVRPGALKTLLDFMIQQPEVGIAGSSLEVEAGKVWPIAFRFPTILSELDAGLRLGIISKLLSNWIVSRPMGNEVCQVDWLPGASMMIRREVFDSVGLMDEKYFLYYEETDYCLQAKKAGWSCWYVPQSRVMHIAGQSTGVSEKTSKNKPLPKYLFESRRRYFVKNHGWLYAALTDAVWILSFSFWRVRRLIQRKPDIDPQNYLRDFIRHSVLFKPVWQASK